MAQAKKAKKDEVKVVPPVEPTRAKAAADTTGGVVPAPVSRVYSSRGLEYLFMVVSLIVLVGGVASLAVDLIAYFFDTKNVDAGLTDWIAIEAVTTVGALFFFYLWSRLRAAEHVTPALLRDPSRKRALQKGLMVGFGAVFISSISVVYTLFDILSDGGSIEKTHWESLVTSLVVTGLIALGFGILFNEERKGE